MPGAVERFIQIGLDADACEIGVPGVSALLAGARISPIVVAKHADLAGAVSWAELHRTSPGCCRFHGIKACKVVMFESSPLQNNSARGRYPSIRRDGRRTSSHGLPSIPRRLVPAENGPGGFDRHRAEATCDPGLTPMVLSSSPIQLLMAEALSSKDLSSRPIHFRARSGEKMRRSWPKLPVTAGKRLVFGVSFDDVEDVLLVRCIAERSPQR